MLKVWETRHHEATLRKKDQVKALVARMEKAKISGRSSHPRLIASYVMVHTRHEIVPRGKP